MEGRTTITLNSGSISKMKEKILNLPQRAKLSWTAVGV
jgi:hypothetical protein